MITGMGDGMGELKHISEMLGISDEDAKEVLKDITASVSTHHLMSDVVGELAGKYGKQSILAGMMLAKTFEANERITSELNKHEVKPVKKYDYGHG